MRVLGCRATGIETFEHAKTDRVTGRPVRRRCECRAEGQERGHDERHVASLSERASPPRPSVRYFLDGPRPAPLPTIDMIEKLPTDENPREGPGGPDDAAAARRAIRAFARIMFRFLCFAALLSALELVRRSPGAYPTDRRTTGAALAFASAGLLGVLLLWKSRAGAAREVLESAAMMGFWTGIFAVIA